jgi:hypothetical protein
VAPRSRKGARVRVVGVNGLTLTVEKAEREAWRDLDGVAASPSSSSWSALFFLGFVHPHRPGVRAA